MQTLADAIVIILKHSPKPMSAFEVAYSLQCAVVTFQNQGAKLPPTLRSLRGKISAEIADLARRAMSRDRRVEKLPGQVPTYQLNATPRRFPCQAASSSVSPSSSSSPESFLGSLVGPNTPAPLATSTSTPVAP